MNAGASAFGPPADTRASVAIDLGAESCRISMLRWIGGQANIELVHRFGNAPVERNGRMQWDLAAICAGVERGLRACAQIATEGIRSIGVDGWGVDYVRLRPAPSTEPTPVSGPFCYRDPRTAPAWEAVHRRISVQRLYERTGVQPLAINTIYQLYADSLAGIPGDAPWVMLPEYVLHWLGGERVAEYTNATTTGLVDLATKDWSREVFEAVGLEIEAAPRIVRPGTDIGRLRGPLSQLQPLLDTRLIVPACHDTASAIAGIEAREGDWAYISSGTWSLVGALIETPCNSDEAREDGFANFGAAENKLCFHKNVNAMWTLRQCMEHWDRQGAPWTIAGLIEKAKHVPPPDGWLDLEDGDLMLAGNMPGRINLQRQRQGRPPIPEDAGHAPEFASLIFHSLAHAYAQILDAMKKITGKNPDCLYIVGGGSRNRLLNRLTERATRIKVVCGEAESSTLGNLKVQLKTLRSREGQPVDEMSGPA